MTANIIRRVEVVMLRLKIVKIILAIQSRPQFGPCLLHLSVVIAIAVAGARPLTQSMQEAKRLGLVARQSLRQIHHSPPSSGSGAAESMA